MKRSMKRTGLHAFVVIERGFGAFHSGGWRIVSHHKTEAAARTVATPWGAGRREVVRSTQVPRSAWNARFR